jgi:dihydrofolate synthase/folylpolyglutamate synthase
METFVETMTEFSPAGELVVVFGQLAGRDPDEMLTVLAGVGPADVVVCTAPSPRAVPAPVLAEAAARVGLSAEVISSVDHAVDRARELAGGDGALAVTGSLTVVGAARSHLAGSA